MIRRLMVPAAALALAALAIAAPPLAAFETKATSAYVYDHRTGTVLMKKNAELPLPPASMSKLMTLYMLFEALRDGRVTLDTEFRVSERAQAMGGSTMFLRAGERVPVRDLILGIIVNSGNDATVVVAEGLAGTEQAFARLMTERAKALGMTNSTLTNASGWPDPLHRMSMQDLALLAQRLIEDFPDFYALFAETEYHYKDRAPANRFNRHPLLGRVEGVDGLKTGHTEEAGFGLVASARQGDRRVTAVYSGLASAEERADEGERLFDWAFRQFTLRKLADAGEVLGVAPVWMGAAPEVGLAPAAPLEVLLPALVQDAIEAEVRYAAPVEAPVAAGAVLGELVLRLPDMPERRVPLVAVADVPRGGVIVRLRTAARVLAARLFGVEAGVPAAATGG